MFVHEKEVDTECTVEGEWDSVKVSPETVSSAEAVLEPLSESVRLLVMGPLRDADRSMDAVKADGDTVHVLLEGLE